MSRNSNPIGLTDSGLGGLSVLLQAMALLPSERFVVLADQALMPYGDKPVHEIENRLLSVSDWFHRRDSKALVLACNTATAAAASVVRQHYPNWPVVGIEPAVKPAAMLTQTGKVGILATANTLASERFQLLVSRFDSVVEVHAQPCRGLVELIEMQPMNWPAIRSLLTPHVSTLLAKGCDVIVLGCTHYPFVRSLVEALAGPSVQVIDTGLPVAKQLRSRLEQAAQLHPPDSASPAEHPDPVGQVEFYTTGQAEEFRASVVHLLGESWATVPVYSLSATLLAT